jgi:hypothetical protein
MFDSQEGLCSMELVLIFPIYAACPAHHLDFINLIIFGEVYKL